MKKSIPLIFLFSVFLIGLLTAFLFPIKAATTTTDYTSYQLLQPVEGDWFYNGRNCYEDFQTYLDGSSPNASITGTVAADSTCGIYTVNSTSYNEFYNITRSDIGSTVYQKNPFLLFQNVSDKNYILKPETVAITDERFLTPLIISDNTTQFTIEFMFYYMVDAISSSGTDCILYFYHEATSHTALRITRNGADNLIKVQYAQGGWNDFSGGAMVLNGYHPYTYTEFYWTLLHFKLSYTFNAYCDVQIYQSYIDGTGDLTTQLKVDHATGFHNLIAGTSNYNNLTMHSVLNSLDGISVAFCGIDSSRMKINYNDEDILDYVDKTLSTYNVESIITVSIQYNASMSDRVIDSIEIMSEKSRDDFITTVFKVKGNTEYEESYYDITSYTEISTILYDNETLDMLTINTRYRCKNLDEFNNTIYISIDWVYTPYSPVFSDLLLSILPATAMLIIPSAVGYYKFKKNGFLIVFFVMTLVLMGIGIIPLVPGLLIITILVIIFLKLMKQTNNDNGGI